MSNASNIDDLLDDIVTLPTLPVTLSRITELVNDPSCSLMEVGKAISTDPAIALKTLRLVNSALYGTRQKVTSVEHATALLGIRVIKNLILTATVFNTFKKSAGYLLRHSIACGVALRTLAEERPQDFALASEDAFAYGLLHDVGKIIFEEFLPKEFAQVVEACHDRHLSCYDAEREIINFDHAQMGARLAQKWRLPDDLVTAIAAHHEVGSAVAKGPQVLAAAISVADYMCYASGIPAVPDAVTHADERLWSSFPLKGPDMVPILERFFDNIPGVEELLQAAS